MWNIEYLKGFIGEEFVNRSDNSWYMTKTLFRTLMQCE